MNHTQNPPEAAPHCPSPAFVVIDATDGMRQQMLAEIVTGSMIGHHLHAATAGTGSTFLRLTTVDPDSREAINLLLDADAAKQLGVHIDAFLRCS